MSLVWFGIAGLALVSGLDYYLMPLDERAFSDLAATWGPTGLVGHGLGIAGSLMMFVGVLGYTIRKRLAVMDRAGALRHWLRVHIFLCTLGPFLVLLHTTFKFGGIVSIAFWSMAIVVASGVFGRYVYVRIPKTAQGQFLGRTAVARRIHELTDVIALQTGIAAPELDRLLAPAVAAPTGLAGAVALATRDGSYRRRFRTRVGRAFAERAVPEVVREGALRLADEQRRLRHQALILHPFQRLFRYWHVLHLPLAAVMFIVLAVHVAVSVAFGYTWIF